MPELDRSRPFSVAQARAAGITRWQLEGRGFQRVLTGVYVAAGLSLSTPVLAAAALLVLPRGSVLSHHTAAALWGGVVPHAADVHASVPADRRIAASGIRAHRVSPLPEATRRRGLPLTTPERTFLDLAAVLDLVELVVLGDSLVRVGATLPTALVTAASTHRGRGARLARRAAHLVRSRAESAMESRLRLLVVLAGLPEPTTQHVVVARRGSYRLDLAWAAVKVALEYDGRHHVQREGQWSADLGRREEVESRGWRFIVAIAGDVYATPAATLGRIEAALRRAGLHVRVTSTEWQRYFPGRSAA